MFKKILDFIFDILQTFVLAAAIYVIMHLFIAQPNMIRGASMENNFHDGEYILTEKITYKLDIKDGPKRGDVVVFEAPNRPDVDYIKRIIALPGEEVMLNNGFVYVNGVKLLERYQPSSIRTAPGSFLREGQPYIVPKDMYFVLGDNRSHSSDSREFGAIKKEAIVGRAVLRYWPIDKFRVIPTPEY